MFDWDLNLKAKQDEMPAQKLPCDNPEELAAACVSGQARLHSNRDEDDNSCVDKVKGEAEGDDEIAYDDNCGVANSNKFGEN